jgi:hypothetical protein
VFSTSRETRKTLAEEERERDLENTPPSPTQDPPSLSYHVQGDGGATASLNSNSIDITGENSSDSSDSPTELTPVPVLCETGSLQSHERPISPNSFSDEDSNDESSTDSTIRDNSGCLLLLSSGHVQDVAVALSHEDATHQAPHMSTSSTDSDASGGSESQSEEEGGGGSMGVFYC